MHQILFMIAIGLGGPPGESAIKSAFSHDYSGYDVFVSTDEFVVLDIDYDKGMVAFRHVYRKIGSNNQSAIPVECGYAGMRKRPVSGVVLGFYDLSSQDIKRYFAIYKSAIAKSECTPQKEAERRLSEAKAYAAELGLSLDHPEPMISATTDGRFTVRLGLDNHVVETSSRRANEVDFKSDPILKPMSMDDALGRQVVVGDVMSGARRIYRTYYQDYWSMGSQGEITFPALFTDGQKMVFLERYHHHNRFEGGCDREMFGFSLIINTASLSLE